MSEEIAAINSHPSSSSKSYKHYENVTSEVLGKSRENVKDEKEADSETGFLFLVLDLPLPWRSIK